jgi:aldose 1-epimerase
MTAGPEIVKLASGDLSLDLCPALGGSIAALRWRHPAGRWVDLLRPASEASLARGDIEGVGCFPLTPFSNRLRSGQFEFQGRQIRLPPNTSGPHVEHGHGWQRPWQAKAVGVDRATLSLTHKAGGWPFDYAIEQRFLLGEAGLSVELMARNAGTSTMPFGFGLHPYFPRTARCRLTAAVGGFWETDHEVMPTCHRAPPPAFLDPTRSLTIEEHALDNAFTGWQGGAVIDWPERNTRLTMTASGNLGFLVVYTPPGEDYFCAEPVSNCTDAFNLAHSREDTGLIVIEPGAAVGAEVTFSPEAC